MSFTHHSACTIAPHRGLPSHFPLALAPEGRDWWTLRAQSQHVLSSRWSLTDQAFRAMFGGPACNPRPEPRRAEEAATLILYPEERARARSRLCRASGPVSNVGRVNAVRLGRDHGETLLTPPRQTIHSKSLSTHEV